MKHKNQKKLCYIFLQLFSVWMITFPLSTTGQSINISDTVGKSIEIAHNTPITLVTDHQLNFKFGEERMVINDGLQPSMLCTQSGALIVQSQNSKKPFPQKRIFYPYAMSTVISRDNGKTWKDFSFPDGNNGVDIEGGAIQLRDGTILALEAYVTPGKNPNQGAGLLYYSKDDWHTLQGPSDITFNIPDAEFLTQPMMGGVRTMLGGYTEEF